MKAAVLHQYDTKLSNPEFVALEEVPEPKIQKSTDVIIRIGGAGVCRTDLHVIEGIWREKTNVKLPYVMGHENAGWVEEVGKGVENFKRGDPVICHPLISNCHALGARRGEDMHIEGSEFPGIDTNGGYADLLRTGESSLIKLPQTLAPKDVAPHADAGLTAYHVAKKASRHLLPGQHVIVIGVGGLGHIAVQVLKALCSADIIALDRSDLALALATECGAHHPVKADENQIEAIRKLTDGKGAEAVIDFVGEGNSIENGLAMTRRNGVYYIVGYGGEIRISALDMITTERSIIGNLVGNYSELVELMELANRGLVDLSTKHYKLQDANRALHDLKEGKIKGRAVLVP
ncbi:MAG: NAD(P)-dependent alcohol dehydrogenase [Verrucomicrobia bacterium]|nr:NAD(P)-dependent alcohol dehydrogenase [Verrucomicrobiota bacterium]MBV8413699.1 NAD(P)-dependent alcohol dehydrogenase [Verrucomicrobiota bacterium]